MKSIDEQEAEMYKQGLDFCFKCRGWFERHTLCKDHFGCCRYWLNMNPIFMKETK